MKTQVAQTSILSYHSLDDLTNRQRDVLRAIRKLGMASNRQIARELDMEIGSVTGRTNELVAKGLVKEDHKARDERTGKLVTMWREV
jgi:DNA-binding MarR family transcriptional regulator